MKYYLFNFSLFHYYVNLWALYILFLRGELLPVIPLYLGLRLISDSSGIVSVSVFGLLRQELVSLILFLSKLLHTGKNFNTKPFTGSSFRDLSSIVYSVYKTSLTIKNSSHLIILYVRNCK